MDTIAISKFKATCLAVLEEVRRTGQPVLVTRRGQPIAEIGPPAHPTPTSSWLGSAIGSGRIAGDVVSPVADQAQWEALAD